MSGFTANNSAAEIEREVERLNKLLAEKKRLAELHDARMIDLGNDLSAEYVPEGTKYDPTPYIDIWTPNNSVTVSLDQLARLDTFVAGQVAAHAKGGR